MAGDHEVGYGKPPRHTRFRPGRSGNPAGRPKGPQTRPADLRAELAEVVTLGEGADARSVSKQRAILRRLTDRALEGDARATALVLDLVRRLLGPSPALDSNPEPDIDPGSGPRERLAAKIAQVHERLAASGGLGSHPYSPGDDPQDES